MSLPLIQLVQRAERDAAAHAHHHHINRQFGDSARIQIISIKQVTNVLTSWISKITKKVRGFSGVNTEDSLPV